MLRKTAAGKTPASGIIKGAGAIALHLWGDENQARALYGMSEERRRALGIFHEGKFLCARAETIDAKLREREGR